MKNKVLTGIKFILKTSDEQKKLLDEHVKRYRILFNQLSKEVFYHYLQDNGKLINQVNGVGASNATLRLRMILKEAYSSLFDAQEYETETLRRNITFQVANRYRGYFKRNKAKPPKPITLDADRAITYNDMMIKYKDGNIIIPICGGKDGKDVKLIISAIIPDIMQQYIKYLPKVFGGTLDKSKKGQYLFIALADKHWESKYEPVDWLGYDIGKNTFLYFSDDINGSDTIVHSDDLVKVRTRITELLKNIGRKDIKSSYRSLFRRQWLNAQTKHKQVLKPIAQTIIDWAKTNKLGLALDGAKFGGKMGSSGQEITDILKDLAVKEFVPFYITKPAYTSQKCPICGYIDKKNRDKKTNTFKCTKCGYFNGNGDKVGALNSKLQAIEWYKNL